MIDTGKVNRITTRRAAGDEAGGATTTKRRRSADCRARAVAAGGGLDLIQAQFGHASRQQGCARAGACVLASRSGGGEGGDTGAEVVGVWVTEAVAGSGGDVTQQGAGPGGAPECGGLVERSVGGGHPRVPLAGAEQTGGHG